MLDQPDAATQTPLAAVRPATTQALAELPDLADHLVALGVRSLQIRPVARAGRARSLADGVDDLHFVRSSAVVAMWILLEGRLGVWVEDVIAVTSTGGRFL